jgi:hypothetical protein
VAMHRVRCRIRMDCRANMGSSPDTILAKAAGLDEIMASCMGPDEVLRDIVTKWESSAKPLAFKSVESRSTTPSTLPYDAWPGESC